MGAKANECGEVCVPPKVSFPGVVPLTCSARGWQRLARSGVADLGSLRAVAVTYYAKGNTGTGTPDKIYVSSTSEFDQELNSTEQTKLAGAFCKAIAQTTGMDTDSTLDCKVVREAVRRLISRKLQQRKPVKYQTYASPQKDVILADLPPLSASGMKELTTNFVKNSNVMGLQPKNVQVAKGAVTEMRLVDLLIALDPSIFKGPCIAWGDAELAASARLWLNTMYDGSLQWIVQLFEDQQCKGDKQGEVLVQADLKNGEEVVSDEGEGWETTIQVSIVASQINFAPAAPAWMTHNFACDQMSCSLYSLECKMFEIPFSMDSNQTKASVGTVVYNPTDPDDTLSGCNRTQTQPYNITLPGQVTKPPDSISESTESQGAAVKSYNSALPLRVGSGSLLGLVVASAILRWWVM